MCSLARFAMSLQAGADATMANQWMERTLDDSAIRRLGMPQAFLAIDACLILYRNISDGMVVYPKVIEKNLAAELPYALPGILTSMLIVLITGHRLSTAVRLPDRKARRLTGIAVQAVFACLIGFGFVLLQARSNSVSLDYCHKKPSEATTGAETPSPANSLPQKGGMNE